MGTRTVLMGRYGIPRERRNPGIFAYEMVNLTQYSLRIAGGAALALALLAAAADASAQEQKTDPRRIHVGVDFGAFFPTSSEVRDAFGDTWFRIGISPLSFQDDDRWKFTFDVAVLQRSSGPNRATLIPVTFGATRGFPSGNKDTVPYVAVRVGPYWGDVRVPSIAVDDEKFGVNGNAAVGVTFNKTFYVEARYDVFSDFSGLSFNGFFFSAGVKLFDFRL